MLDCLPLFPSLSLQIRCLLSTPVFVRAGQEVTGVVQLTANERCVPCCTCPMTFTSCHIRSTSCFSSPDKAMMSTWTSLSQAQVFTSQAPMISRIQSSTPWVHPSVLDLTKLLPAWVPHPSLLDPTKPTPRRHTGIHKPSKPSQHTSGPRLNTIRG